MSGRRDEEYKAETYVIIPEAPDHILGLFFQSQCKKLLTFPLKM